MKLTPALALVLAGCSLTGLSRPAPIEVREVARSMYCNTPGDAARALLLKGAQAVVDWQVTRGVVLAGPESLAQATYVVVEHGARNTGGYSLAVARAAGLRGEEVVLHATFFVPRPDAMTTQALTSPCVLVQLPAGRYASVEVQDADGTVRASGGFTEAPATVVPEAVQ